MKSDPAKNAPSKPGVYLWKDEKGRILYVGKARNLKARLSSYANPADERTKKLVESCDSVETIITKTEEEALILEDALVKQNQPRYNVRLRDDKNYPYIKVTVEDEYPSVSVTRKVEADGSRYFGPYTDSYATKRMLDILGEFFGVRTCRYDLRRLERPCIRYNMGKCACPHLKLPKKEYDDRIRKACDFLSGRHGAVLKKLRSRMKKHSGRWEYEQAAKLKKSIGYIESLNRRQDVSSAGYPNMDVLGHAIYEGKANVTMLKVRSGRVVAMLHYPLKGEYMLDCRQALKAFIKQHYTSCDLTPKLIITSCEPQDRKLVEDFLSRLCSGKVSVHYARRGGKRRLAELACENSIHHLKHISYFVKPEDRVKALGESLGLDKPPVKIEGYDVSNIGDRHVVGGMVVYTNGVPDKSQYRRFKVKAEGQDDPASLSEVVSRRFKHHEWKMPDLVLLDGGLPQLNACLPHIPEGVSVVSLAKKLEIVHMPGRKKPLRLGKDEPGVLLLRAVRDEAHRYGHSYHRNRRRKAFKPKRRT